MGLLVAMVLYPIISPSTRHRSIVIALRVLALPLIIVLFVVLIRNFYTSDPYAGVPFHLYILGAHSQLSQRAHGVDTSHVFRPAPTITARGE